MRTYASVLAIVLCGAMTGSADAGLFDGLWKPGASDSCCPDSCVDPCVDDCVADLIDDCVDDSCCVDSCCGVGGSEKLFGLIAHSDPCFNDFISPISNPIFFEDPRTVSELRPIYIYHTIPQGVGGGQVNLMAVQFRAALTDRLSIIATKDGYMTSSNPIIDDGFNDVAVGVKYNFHRDVVAGQLLTGGVTYEAPWGSHRAAQGNGDGEFHLYLSGGTRVGEKMHYVAGSGLRLPADQADESMSFYLSQHLDYMLIDEKFYLLTELNWYRWLQGGNRGVPGVPNVEGMDVINLGAPAVAGNNIVTWAWGFKVKPAANQEIGMAYEIPISSRNDIMNNRFTVDYIIRY